MYIPKRDRHVVHTVHTDIARMQPGLGCLALMCSAIMFKKLTAGHIDLMWSCVVILQCMAWWKRLQRYLVLSTLSARNSPLLCEAHLASTHFYSFFGLRYLLCYSLSEFLHERKGVKYTTVHELCNSNSNLWIRRQPGRSVNKEKGSVITFL